MVGSINGRKGELIKKMCEEIRARIRVLDAPMCPNCFEDPPGGCSKTVSVIEEKRNPNGLCSSSVLKSAKESSLCTVSGTCVPIFVYQRKNGPGISENIGFDQTSVVLRRIGDCDSIVCSNAPSIAETEASGAPIMPSLGLDDIPTRANSQDHVGGCSKTVSVTKEKRTPNGLCSSSVLKSTKESSLNTIFETCVPISVYKRKNGPGGCENIGFDNTSVFLRRIGDCGSTICSIAPSIAETEASGTPIMPSSESDTKPTCTNSQDPASGCSKSFSVMEEKRNPRGLSSLSVLKSTKESSLNPVSETCIPIFVYKRKNRQGGSENIGFDMTSVVLRRIGDCDSIICSAAPSIAEKVASGASIMPSSESDAKPICGYSQEHVPNEKPTEPPKIIDMDSVNESCSSRSNAEPVSVPSKTRVEESGECSSSSVIAIEAQEDSPLTERDICISILQSRGLLQKEKSPSSSSFEDGNEISTNNSYRGGSRKCKACCRSESAKKMLICDSCDEAFHLSCCNSRGRSFRDDDEWLCTSCLTKRHILVRQTGNMMRSTRIGYEVDRSMLTPAAEKSSPISLILRDSGPYQTSVRVGKGFQADVPDWTGPVKGDDMFGEPEELDTTVHSNLHVCNSSRSRKLSSIGNWLQCKQVIDDGGETICGKWRRAPLFEVQTDEWECFCSVFWDPSHADCAVPQELDTDQVLKQLKYIEMLRPQLAAKRRKLVRPQLNGS